MLTPLYTKGESVLFSYEGENKLGKIHEIRRSGEIWWYWIEDKEDNGYLVTQANVLKTL